MTTATDQFDDFVYQEEEADFDAMSRGGQSDLPMTLKEGLNIVRILPPFGEAQKPDSKYRGFIFAENYVHWLSFPGTNGKTIFKVVRCIKTSKEAACPACERADRLQAAYEKLVAEYSHKDEKKDLVVAWDKMPKPIAENAKKIRDAAQAIKWQRSYYYNVLTQDGRVKRLKVSKTAGQDLNNEIKKCTTLGFNPVSLKAGCFMVMEKTKNSARQTDVTVKAYPLQTSTNEGGKIRSETVLSALEPSIMKGAKDLFSLYPTKTFEEMKRAVAGDLSVFEKPKTESVTILDEAAVAALAASVDVPVEATVTVTAPTPAATTATVPPTTVTTPEPQKAPETVSADVTAKMDDLLADLDL